jgi:hypothetical protein
MGRLPLTLPGGLRETTKKLNQDCQLLPENETGILPLKSSNVFYCSYNSSTKVSVHHL